MNGLLLVGIGSLIMGYLTNSSILKALGWFFAVLGLLVHTHHI